MIGLIVGAGRIGFNLAKSMSEDHDITIIEKDKQRCQIVADLIDCYIIQGSGTNTKILEEAEIKKSDFFIAASGNDEVNLLSSVYAKEQNVKTIVSILNNLEHEEIFKKLKIRAVNPEKSTMRYIARNINRPTAQSLVSIGKGNAEILEIKVDNSELLFTPISEIENNSNKFKIISVYSDKEVILPTSDTEIGYDDNIAVLVKNQYIDEVKNYFTIDNYDIND